MHLIVNFVLVLLFVILSDLQQIFTVTKTPCEFLSVDTFIIDLIISENFNYMVSSWCRKVGDIASMMYGQTDRQT